MVHLTFDQLFWLAFAGNLVFWSGVAIGAWRDGRLDGVRLDARRNGLAHRLAILGWPVVKDASS